MRDTRTFAAAVVVVAATISAAPAFAAESADAEGKARPVNRTQKSMPADKPLEPDKLFADTKKYLAEKAARTAEIIKTNAAKLQKKVTDPQPAATPKKASPKKPRKVKPEPLSTAEK